MLHTFTDLESDIAPVWGKESTVSVHSLTSSSLLSISLEPKQKRNADTDR